MRIAQRGAISTRSGFSVVSELDQRELKNHGLTGRPPRNAGTAKANRGDVFRKIKRYLPKFQFIVKSVRMKK
jgi:hypothetical protein